MTKTHSRTYKITSWLVVAAVMVQIALLGAFASGGDGVVGHDARIANVVDAARLPAQLREAADLDRIAGVDDVDGLGGGEGAVGEQEDGAVGVACDGVRHGSGEVFKGGVDAVAGEATVAVEGDA